MQYSIQVSRELTYLNVIIIINIYYFVENKMYVICVLKVLEPIEKSHSC